MFERLVGLKSEGLEGQKYIANLQIADCSTRVFVLIIPLIIDLYYEHACDLSLILLEPCNFLYKFNRKCIY